MGMYDRVWAECPECGNQIEFQSKAGECVLADYSTNSVPPNIAEDIKNDSEECPCGYIVRFRDPEIDMVQMTVITE